MTARPPGNLTCMEVLERLSDAVDDDLTATERWQIETHLATCTHCTRFGASFTLVLSRLKQHHRDLALNPDVLERLQHALRRAQ